MNNLEEYIKRNREAFDDQEIPEGHLGRFEAMLDGGEARPSGSGDGLGRERWTGLGIWLWTAVAGVAAAVAAVAIFINRPAENREDWFADVPGDQTSICRAYYDKMADLYGAILAEDTDGSKEAELVTVAEETVPLIDQLPEELGEEERVAILRAYYSDLLDGIERIREIK